MKFLKVTVNKEIINGGSKFIYPSGYDANKISIEGYEHKATPSKINETEFCLGKAADDFPESADMVVLTQTDYDDLLVSITPVA